ncbi:MAG: 50S ribosomal protein L20 [Saprospiraceae bacterium]|nr:50S ribosomal protein L20 [Saprospiraceae bacterium]
MPRSVNAVASRARRKKILKAAKGYFGRRKNVISVAKNAVDKAMGYAFVGRKLKKRAYRQLWIARINAGARINGTTYSRLMHKLSANKIDLNRKSLADLALNHPDSFKAVVSAAKIVFSAPNAMQRGINGAAVGSPFSCQQFDPILQISLMATT